MSYRMDGGKTPGSSANETGTGLPPSLIGWVDSLSDINWAQLGKNLQAEASERKENQAEKENLPFKGAKKKRFANNTPKDAAENAQFIAAGGGSRPAY